LPRSRSSVAAKVDRTALGQLTRDYESFLSSERGLAPATLISYLPIVRRFLTAHFGNKTLRLQDLQPQEVGSTIAFRPKSQPTTYANLSTLSCARVALVMVADLLVRARAAASRQRAVLPPL